MAEKKSVKKPAAVRVKKAKPVAEPPKKPALKEPPPGAMRKVVGPSARNCPLVLDGEVDAADFSEADCLTCGEFDCRFCESHHGSGSLKSRLFAGGDEGDDDEGEDGLDLDFGEGDEGGAGGDEEDEGEEEI